MLEPTNFRETIGTMTMKRSKRIDTETSASAVEILRAEQRVHDATAAEFMRQAAKHLRVATKLDREIGKLIDPKEARAA